jgi:hypothetical protein
MPVPPMPPVPRPSPGVPTPRGGPVPRRGVGPMPRWGWLEWVILSQAAMPALMFVPGLAATRIVTRIATFALPLLAWALVAQTGRRPPGARPFPAVPWAAAAGGWLAASVLHPQTNSPTSGAAEALINLAILSPAFWATAALVSPRQIGRLMAILFLWNAASAVVGIGQFYQPARFNPPVIQTSGGLTVEDYAYETGDGRRVIRPCGLTDSPGGACAAGMLAGLLGLGWSLQPMAAWRRLASLGLAFAGLLVIYLSQVRSALVMEVISLLTLMAVLAVRRDFRRLTLLGLGVAVVLGGSLAWVARTEGDAVLRRFRTLIEGDPRQTFYANRGFYTRATFSRQIWDQPLGAGLGRCGQAYLYFGDRAAPPDRGQMWAEVQWTMWAIEGGIPLIILYTAAMAVALATLLRIALTCRDRTLAYWAAVILALNLSIVATTFSYIPFIAPTGLQFWIMAAALHAADRRQRLVASG